MGVLFLEPLHWFKFGALLQIEEHLQRYYLPVRELDFRALINHLCGVQREHNFCHATFSLKPQWRSISKKLLSAQYIILGFRVTTQKGVFERNCFLKHCITSISFDLCHEGVGGPNRWFIQERSNVNCYKGSTSQDCVKRHLIFVELHTAALRKSARLLESRQEK